MKLVPCWRPTFWLFNTSRRQEVDASECSASDLVSSSPDVVLAATAKTLDCTSATSTQAVVPSPALASSWTPITHRANRRHTNARSRFRFPHTIDSFYCYRYNSLRPELGAAAPLCRREVVVILARDQGHDSIASRRCSNSSSSWSKLLHSSAPVPGTVSPFHFTNFPPNIKAARLTNAHISSSSVPGANADAQVRSCLELLVVVVIALADANAETSTRLLRLELCKASSDNSFCSLLTHPPVPVFCNHEPYLPRFYCFLQLLNHSSLQLRRIRTH